MKTLDRFTKRQRRVRSGGRLGDLHRKVVSHYKGAMVEYTHAPLDISPLWAFGLADQSPPGYYFNMMDDLPEQVKGRILTLRVKQK